MRQSDSLVGGLHRLLGSTQAQVTALACLFQVVAATWKHNLATERYSFRPHRTDESIAKTLTQK